MCFHVLFYFTYIFSKTDQWLFKICKGIALCILPNMESMYWSCLLFQRQCEVRKIKEKKKKKQGCEQITKGEKERKGNYENTYLREYGVEHVGGWSGNTDM